MKYYITTTHGDAFAVRFEVPKRTFKSELKDNKQYAKIEGIEANAEPNERGEFYRTEFIEWDNGTIQKDIFGAGTSETIFEEVCPK